MKRLLWLLPCLALAGCEQTRPPTAEGLKLIKARTATGTQNSKLETKTQPSPPRAGEVSIWDFKVFEAKDKPDGTRKERKFFNPLPQSSSDKATTQVQMNAWLISRDKTVFLPQKPVYKAYGSFLTDWIIPRGGDYTLWVEYQPVDAKDELSSDDLKGAKILPVEHARWDVTVSGSSKTSPLTPQGRTRTTQSGEVMMTVYSLNLASYGTKAPFEVKMSEPGIFRVNVAGTLSWTLDSPAKSAQMSEAAMTALSPDGKTLLHAVGEAPRVTFTQPGKWRVWFSFSLDGKLYAAPVDFEVK